MLRNVINSITIVKNNEIIVKEYSYYTNWIAFFDNVCHLAYYSEDKYVD